MDDGDLGRPPRHERERSVSEPRGLAVLARGSGQHVEIDQVVACEKGCGRSVHVAAAGPDDSIIVRLARDRLAGPMCDQCVEEEREQFEREARRAEWQATLDRRRERSKIPVALRNVSLDKLEEDPARREAFALAKAWADGDTPGALLHGPVGRGKTVLAAAAAMQRCSLGHVRWISVAELLLDLRMPFSSPEYVRAQRALDAKSGVALVLDDLDKLKPTEHAMQPLYVAINGWVESRLPLLVTLNRSLGELAEWGGETFGEAIASRLAGYCDVAAVGGRDRRLS